MENRKIFVLPHKLLIALLLFTSTLCLSFVIPKSWNLSQIIGINKPKIEIINSNADNQQRVAEFQTAMEASLNEQLKQKNLLSVSPTSFNGKIIYEIKPIGNKKVIALTFDDGPWKIVLDKH